jgi:hypothetical protein
MVEQGARKHAPLIRESKKKTSFFFAKFAAFGALGFAS